MTEPKTLFRKNSLIGYMEEEKSRPSTYRRVYRKDVMSKKMSLK